MANGSSLFITAVATCFLAGLALLAGAAAYLQIRHMRRGREMDFSIQVMQELRTPKWTERYRQLYNSPRNVWLQETLPWRQDFELILDRLEWVAITVARGSVPIELAVKLIGGLPLRVWYMLYEYADIQDVKRGHYARNVEDLVKRILTFQIRCQPYSKWTKLTTEGKYEVELVPELINMMVLTKWELRCATIRRRWYYIRRHRHLRPPKEEWSKLCMTRPSMNSGISILDAKKVVIFSPHEDDAELACGGTINKRMKLGRETQVAYLTDGRNSHLAVFGIKENPTPEELKELREQEAVEAQKVLGNSTKALHFFDYEDTRLFRNRDEAVSYTSKFLRLQRPTVILMPYRNDRHPDHLETYHIVNRAIKKSKMRVYTFEYFVWSIGNIPEMLKPELLYIDVKDELTIKREAISKFNTQITKFSDKQPRPVLSPELIEGFFSGQEVFLPSTKLREPFYKDITQRARQRIFSYYMCCWQSKLVKKSLSLLQMAFL